MNIEKEIGAYCDTQAEPKRSELLSLHRLIMSMRPLPRLWFHDGKNAEGKVVSNPTMGYGTAVLRYANGSTAETFRIGVSGNTTGISVYILGLKDKEILKKNFGKDIGKASITGYCIKFKTVDHIRLDVLEKAIRFGLEQKDQ